MHKDYETGSECFVEGVDYKWNKRWHWFWVKREALLLRDYHFESETVTGETKHFFIRKGFLWNGPSLLRAKQNRMRATLIHDYIYRDKPEGISRRIADQHLFDKLKEDGASKIFRFLVESFPAKVLYRIAWVEKWLG